MSMHGANKALNNLNDNWTEEDYDKYFDAMNLDKKERKDE